MNVSKSAKVMSVLFILVSIAAAVFYYIGLPEKEDKASVTFNTQVNIDNRKDNKGKDRYEVIRGGMYAPLSEEEQAWYDGFLDCGGKDACVQDVQDNNADEEDVVQTYLQEGGALTSMYRSKSVQVDQETIKTYHRAARRRTGGRLAGIVILPMVVVRETIKEALEEVTENQEQDYEEQIDSEIPSATTDPENNHMTVSTSSTTAVDAPDPFWLLAGGLLGVGILRRRS